MARHIGRMRRLRSKTGGGVGSNQYGRRGSAKQPVSTLPTSPRDALSSILITGEAYRLRRQARLIADLLEMRTSPVMVGDQDIDLDTVHQLQNPGCPPKRLVAESKSNIYEIQALVALHPNTPTAVLKRLAAHRDLRVVRGVALNPKCPSKMLKRLAKAKWDTVRAAVLHNPHCPPSVSDQLLHDHSLLVQASHSGTSRIRLAELGAYTQPPGILPPPEVGSATPTEIREAVASNPSCPLITLIELTQDGQQRVRQAALYNPACPEYVRVIVALGHV